MFKYLTLFAFLSPIVFFGQTFTDEEKAAHQEKIEYGIHKLEEDTYHEIDRLNEQLETLEAKMADIKKFKWGRPQSEKDQQLKEQSEAIARTKLTIKNRERLLRAIPTLHSKTFDFQNDPKSLVEYIFNAAKKRRFFKLKHLCDPYAENDYETKNICFISYRPQHMQNGFQKGFSESRILGEPKIINRNIDGVEITVAILEITVGREYGNRIEKIGLVKRLGKWYLYGM